VLVRSLPLIFCTDVIEQINDDDDDDDCPPGEVSPGEVSPGEVSPGEVSPGCLSVQLIVARMKCRRTIENISVLQVSRTSSADAETQLN